MADTAGETWERRDGESAPAWEAFVSYRDLGPARSITKVARQLGKSRALVGRWSRTYAWVLRAAAWDQEQDRIFAAEQQQARREMARRHAKLAQAVLAKAVARLQGLNAQELSPGELLRYIQTATDIERRAFGADSTGAVAQVVETAGDATALTDEERRVRMDQLRRELERRLADVREAPGP